jgi:acyl carrier protein
MSEVKDKIQGFIVENFLFGNAEGLEDDTSFLEEGIIDSTGVLELVGFIEEDFSITVEDEELVPENLDSINNVTTYLERKLIRQDLQDCQDFYAPFPGEKAHVQSFPAITFLEPV